MRISDWSSDVCSSDLMDRAEACAIVGGDTRVLALGVDADDRAGIVEQVGDDGAHALAGARRRDRQQMGGAGIAQRLARFAVAADQQAVAILGEGARLAIGGEAGRAVGIVARSEEHTSELQSLMRISYAVFCLKKKNNYTQ